MEVHLSLIVPDCASCLSRNPPVVSGDHPVCYRAHRAGIIIADETEKWAEVVKLSGAKVD